MRRACELFGIGGMAVAATALIAYAQTAPGPGQPATTEVSALAPVLCYEGAETGENLARLSALQLCVGAVSDAPARCSADASAQGSFADSQVVRLCTMATSTDPAECARRLADTTALPATTIVQYCAANPWPVVPALGSGDPACIEAALDRVGLPQLDASRLCAGSGSDAPVACFEWGDDRLAIANADLITLCAAVVVDRPQGLAPAAQY